MIKDIISPLLGAAIGYFTNWLAIKMLFLPYEPKYIGKFKIPFTPGLIPKERKKLSEKIANVTEEKILNKETIKENLFSEENKEKIYYLLEKNFYTLKEKDYTIDDILNKIDKEKKYELIDRLEEIIYKNIYDILYNEKNQENLSNFIIEKIITYINNEDTKEKLENMLISFINNKNVKESIKNVKLSNIICDEGISNIKISIFENMPKICNFICDKLENDEKLDEKLSHFIKKIIEENINPLTGLFVNKDKIYITIKKNIISYLNDSENQNIIGIKIFELISLYQNKTIFDMYNKLPEQIKYIIKEKSKDENLKIYINKIKILDNIIYNESFKNNINVLTQNLLKYFSEKFYTYSKEYIKNNKHKLLNIHINIILDKICIEKFKDNIFNFIQKFIDKEGDNILKNIPISNMIENKINSFDMYTIENLIVSVTKKELNSITIIGGVLGFVIGLIPVILK